MNSDYVTWVRTKLTQGHKISDCSACWKAEAAGTVSLRQRTNCLLTNGQWQNQELTWIHKYIDRKDNWQAESLLSADIKFGNLCNFNCVMCHPTDSTKVLSHWQKNVNHPAIQSRIAAGELAFLDVRSTVEQSQNVEIIQYAIDSGVRWLQILGGEPLISRELLTLLANQPQAVKDRIHLAFITNGSENLISVRERLGDYRHVTFSVSLEGIGAVQEYMRRGSDWAACEANIDQYLQVHSKKYLHVCYTLQCLTVCQFGKLQQWAQDRNISVTVTPLIDPDFLSLGSLPPALYPLARANLGQANGLLNDVAHQPQLISKLRSWLDFWDPNGQWKSVLPEWQPYL
jgi:organic radical activating enzyme